MTKRVIPSYSLLVNKQTRRSEPKDPQTNKKMNKKLKEGSVCYTKNKKREKTEVAHTAETERSLPFHITSIYCFFSRYRQFFPDQANSWLDLDKVTDLDSPTRIHFRHVSLFFSPFLCDIFPYVWYLWLHVLVIRHIFSFAIFFRFFFWIKDKETRGKRKKEVKTWSHIKTNQKKRSKD